MNKIFNIFCLLIFGFAFPQNQLSQNQKIDSIIIGNQTFQAYKANIIDYGINAMKSAYPNAPKAFWDEIDSRLTDSEILKQIREAYKEVFTENEINELYNSITSKSFKKYTSEYGNIQERIQGKFSWIGEKLSKLETEFSNNELSSRFDSNDFVPVKTNLQDGFYEVLNDEKIDVLKMKLSKKPAIGLKNVSDAKENLDGLNRRVISLNLDEEGSALFHLLSYQNIGKPIAIVVNKKIISAPVVNDVIPNGKIQISGKFSAQEVKEIITILNSK
jgi:preprotein translocase subunit SecD